MKQIDGDILFNRWLVHHNLDVEKVKKKHPKLHKTAKWFSKYPVTQEQHDEWVNWAKEYIKKQLKISKHALERGWWSIYLNYAPSVKQNNKK